VQSLEGILKVNLNGSIKETFGFDMHIRVLPEFVPLTCLSEFGSQCVLPEDLIKLKLNSMA
jgi:hypothetical protein